MENCILVAARLNERGATLLELGEQQAAFDSLRNALDHVGSADPFWNVHHQHHQECAIHKSEHSPNCMLCEQSPRKLVFPCDNRKSWVDNEEYFIYNYPFFFSADSTVISEQGLHYGKLVRAAINFNMALSLHQRASLVNDSLGVLVRRIANGLYCSSFELAKDSRIPCCAGVGLLCAAAMNNITVIQCELQETEMFKHAQLVLKHSIRELLDSDPTVIGTRDLSGFLYNESLLAVERSSAPAA